MLKELSIEDLKNVEEGKIVKLAGWVHRVRVLGKVGFLLLRDSTGVIQIVFVKNENPELFTYLKTVNREDVVFVEGKIVKNEKAPGGIEINPLEFKIINKAQQPLPLDTDEKTQANLDTRLDYRFLDLRKPTISQMFRKRSLIIKAMFDYLIENKFVEINTPKIIAAATEGGAELFPIVYYDKEAYLGQSPQLYKQMLVSSLERVFELGPAFRAERSNTTRHLSEFTSFDIEAAFFDQDDLINLEKEMLTRGLKAVGMEDQATFKVITYDNALEILKDIGIHIEWGEDLGTEAEKKIGEYFLNEGINFVFIKNWPYSARPFYVYRERNNPELTRGFDLLFKGLEITSGGQREHEYERLVQNIEEDGMNPESFGFYLEAFKYGMPPHGGFGLGMERLIKQLFNLENVREASLFPRDPERLVP
jgi:aspartyl-tRNA synthetase